MSRHENEKKNKKVVFVLVFSTSENILVEISAYGCDCVNYPSAGLRLKLIGHDRIAPEDLTG